jgi:hypothetical protein
MECEDGGKGMQPLIVEVNERSLLDDFNSAKSTSPDDHMKWMTAVNLLGRYDIYNGLPFYKFEIYDKQTKQELHLENGKINLRSGRNYLLSTIHVVANNEHANSTDSRSPETPYMELGPYQLEVTSDQAIVSISPRLQPLSGRYDKFDFEFSVSSSKKAIDKLRATFSVPKDISKSYRPIFEIPVLFRPRFQGLVLRALGLLALSIIWLLLNFQDDIRAFLTPDVSEYIAQFSLVFFALTCVDFVKYLSHLAKSQ